jgi:hypothetical protein
VKYFFRNVKHCWRNVKFAFRASYGVPDGTIQILKNKSRQSGFYFLPQHFRRKYITGEACFTRRKACFTDLHSKSASLPIGHLLPFCYKQNFSYSENPANCTNFSKSETFLLASGFYRAIMDLVALFGEQILKGNQEKCLKSASSSPRTAPP